MRETPHSAGQPGGDGAGADRTGVEAARLWRLLGSVGALLVELRSLPGSAVSVDMLAPRVRVLLAEAEDLVPPSLCDELHRLVGPVRSEGETERDLRMLLAGLEGWIEGLNAQLITVLNLDPENAPPPER